MDFLAGNWFLVVLVLLVVVLVVFGPKLLRRYRAYTLYQAGASYMRNKQFEQAVNTYRESIRLWPTFGAYNNLGIACSNMGKLEDALAAYQEALRLNPEHAPTINNLGVAYYQMGRYADAAEYIEKATQLRPPDNPDQARLHFNLGLAYLATGQSERARDTYNTALQQAQPEEIADAQHGLAELLKKLPQRPAGADTIEQMLQNAQAPV